MHVALISRDESLHRLCRAVVAALPVHRGKLPAVSPDDPRPAAGLYLWDWEPRMPAAELFAEPMAPRRRMLAIERGQARRVFGELPCSTVTLVLKPVNPDALRAFPATLRLQECDRNSGSESVWALLDTSRGADDRFPAVCQRLRNGRPHKTMVCPTKLAHYRNSGGFTPRGGDIRMRGYPAFWARRSAAVSRERVLVERRRMVSPRPNASRVAVSDNGMGVSPAHPRTVFEQCTSYRGGTVRPGSGSRQGVTFVFHLPFAGTRAGESSDPVRSGIHSVAETAGGVSG